MNGDKSKGFGARLKRGLIRGVASLLIGPTAASLAQTPAPPPAYEPAPAAPPAAPGPEAQPPKFTQAELDHLLAPVALFPDALLAQLLPAAAYPLEIVQAHRWLERNAAAVAKQDFSGADAQNWDPSVKAMVRFPTVLEKMNDDLDWTRNLGDAIVNQPQEVAETIQRLRFEAQQAGALKSSDQLNVVTRKDGARDVIVIESPNPEVVYVPRYDPAVVWGANPGVAIAAGLLTFGAGVAIGSAWRGNYWNWNTGVFYPPIWPGYPGWHPGMPGGGGNNISIGGGGNNNTVIGGRPWRPDPDRRPGGRPGGGGPINRPGPGGGNIGVRPPGGGPGGGLPINRPGPGGGGNAGVRPPGGGGSINRPGPGGGGNVGRPGGPVTLPGPGGGNIGIRPPGGGQITRPGPGGGGNIARPGGPVTLPGPGGRPNGGVGGLPGQRPGGMPAARPAPGGRPGFPGGGGGAPGHRGGAQARPAHPGFQGGGGHGGHRPGGGGHHGGGVRHHGGGGGGGGRRR